MRYIDSKKLKVSAKWIEKAKKATEELLKKPPAERGEYINKNEKIWQDKDLKRELEKLSNQKCWYCEALSAGFDLDVDHFRPKNQITDYDTGEVEEGSYWWLAFDVNNYRLGCNFCNRPHKDEDGITRGKAAYFPLCSGSNRCDENGGVDLEKPILLDPTNRSDPPLLWFGVEGKAFEISPEGSEDYERASKTIKILHLNNFKAKAYRIYIKEQCDRIIKDGDRAMDLMPRDHDEGLKNLISVISQAEALMNEKAPFSSAARTYLKSSTDVWIEIYLKHYSQRI